MEFLGRVERAGRCAVRIEDAGEYGVDESVFRQMLIDLIRNGYLCGLRSAGLDGMVRPEDFDDDVRLLLRELTTKGSVEIVVGHSGRVHLALLRRELTTYSQAERDRLTGLGPTKVAIRALQAELSLASPELGAYLLILDIDRFKAFNDRFGHTSGDEALRSVAGIVEREAAYVEGAPFRYGGEEFCIVGLGDRARIVKVANVVRASIERRIAREWELDQPLTVTVGVGFFSRSVPVDSARAFVDALVHSGKHLGGNVVVDDVFEGGATP